MTDLRSVLRAVDVAESVDPSIEERVLGAAADVLRTNRRRRGWTAHVTSGPAVVVGAAVVVIVAVVAGALQLRGDGGGTALSAVENVPFHGTFVTRRATAAETTTEVWYRGPDVRRIEGPEGLTVTDGEHTLLHGGLVDDEHEADGMYVRNEYRRGFWQGPLSYFDENACESPTPVVDDPPTRVLGRPTRHVQCPTSGGPPTDLWIDVATGLVLRFSYGDVLQEATSLELDPPGGFDDDLFSTDVPEGGVDAAEVQREEERQPLGAVVKPGARLRAIEGDIVREGKGGGASPLPLKGRWRLVLVTAPWCAEAGCEAGWSTLRTGSHAGVTVISSMADAADTREAFESWTSDVPIVHIDEDELDAWDLGAVPTWIVFDEDGEVTDAVVGPLDNLDEVLGAVAGDRRPPPLEGPDV